MNEDRFWAIMETIWMPMGAANDLSPSERLKQIIEQLGFEALLGFCKLYGYYQNELLKPEHLCAVFLLNDGILGDEEFSVYSEALIGAPRMVFLDIKACPDHVLSYQ